MRRIGWVAVAVAVGVVAGSCQPESKTCLSETVCPAGYKCTAVGDACIPAGSRCGDGRQDPEETCDDGNANDGDGCSHDCRSLEVCGNRITDKDEACDNGEDNGSDAGNPDGGAICSADCKSRVGCGNGIRDEAYGEECDDGNLDDEDNCPFTCQVAFCGDGFTNDAGRREQCDGPGETVSCNVNCTWTRCGDGLANVTAQEQCDTAGNSATCNADCTLARCGDGFFNHDAGEQCDTAGNSAACNANCKVARCGDGFFNLDAGEDCDPGGIDTAACNANCKVARCGDVYVNRDAGEDCDQGGIDTDTCNSNCKQSRCGDGHRNTDAGEACDDGNIVDEGSCPYGIRTCPGCSSTCGVLSLRGPYCGDGDAGFNHSVDTDAGEVCDDGNNVNETDCPYGPRTCSTCNASCTQFLTLTAHYCGDGAEDPLPGGGMEACDDGNNNNETSCPYGTPICTPCNSTCTVRLSLSGPYCGDGVKNGPEACDDGNASSCGTCSADCSVIQVGSATGKIIAVDAGSLNQGEQFTLNDGFLVRTFEFDKNLIGVDAGTVRIITVPTSSGMATEITNAINSQAGFRITASASGRQVNLDNAESGSIGNQPITENVLNTNFAVTGMSGGGGSDCPAGTKCTVDLDCADPLNCRGPAGSRTCQP